MNLGWMLGLAVLILLEETWRFGSALAYAAGAALVGVALAAA